MPGDPGTPTVSYASGELTSDGSKNKRLAALEVAVRPGVADVHDPLEDGPVVEVGDLPRTMKASRSEGPRRPAFSEFWLSATFTPWFIVSSRPPGSVRTRSSDGPPSPLLGDALPSLTVLPVAAASFTSTVGPGSRLAGRVAVLEGLRKTASALPPCACKSVHRKTCRVRQQPFGGVYPLNPRDGVTFRLGHRDQRDRWPCQVAP
jgi:hypothetical protein